MTEEKHSNIAENTENHTVCIKEEPFRPPTDRLARIAVIAAAVELIFGLLMLLKCIFPISKNLDTRRRIQNMYHDFVFI